MTLCLGGDVELYDQVKQALVHDNPVVLLSSSGGATAAVARLAKAAADAAASGASDPTEEEALKLLEPFVRAGDGTFATTVLAKAKAEPPLLYVFEDEASTGKRLDEIVFEAIVDSHHRKIKRDKEKEEGLQGCAKQYLPMGPRQPPMHVTARSTNKDYPRRFQLTAEEASWGFDLPGCASRSDSPACPSVL